MSLSFKNVTCSSKRATSLHHSRSRSSEGSTGTESSSQPWPGGCTIFGWEVPRLVGSPIWPVPIRAWCSLSHFKALTPWESMCDPAAAPAGAGGQGAWPWEAGESPRATGGRVTGNSIWALHTVMDTVPTPPLRLQDPLHGLCFSPEEPGERKKTLLTWQGRMFMVGLCLWPFYDWGCGVCVCVLVI